MGSNETFFFIISWNYGTKFVKHFYKWHILNLFSNLNNFFTNCPRKPCKIQHSGLYVLKHKQSRSWHWTKSPSCQGRCSSPAPWRSPSWPDSFPSSVSCLAPPPDWRVSLSSHPCWGVQPLAIKPRNIVGPWQGARSRLVVQPKVDLCDLCDRMLTPSINI